MSYFVSLGGQIQPYSKFDVVKSQDVVLSFGWFGGYLVSLCRDRFTDQVSGSRPRRKNKKMDVVDVKQKIQAPVRPARTGWPLYCVVFKKWSPNFRYQQLQQSNTS